MFIQHGETSNSYEDASNDYKNNDSDDDDEQDDDGDYNRNIQQQRLLEKF